MFPRYCKLMQSSVQNRTSGEAGRVLLIIWNRYWYIKSPLKYKKRGFILLPIYLFHIIARIRSLERWEVLTRNCSIQEKERLHQLETLFATSDLQALIWFNNRMTWYCASSNLLRSTKWLNSCYRRAPPLSRKRPTGRRIRKKQVLTYNEQ